MSHPVLVPGAVAVVTGAASGIGLEAACRFAGFGMTVALVDLDPARLEAAAATVRARAPDAETALFAVDVSDREAVVALAAEVEGRFGGVDLLMNNAAASLPTDALGPETNWKTLLDVNLWGVIHGCQAFGPGMIARGRPGLIVNTGSKQGITNPPGNPAYNVSKAAVRAYTEALAHELRNTGEGRVSAHLLIPGFVFTGMTARGRTDKPAGAWTPAQTVDFMLEGLAAGDFYILCPDEDVDRALDQKRMQWAMGDIIENRPALSRWHPDYADRFAAFVAD